MHEVRRLQDSFPLIERCFGASGLGFDDQGEHRYARLAARLAAKVAALEMLVGIEVWPVRLEETASVPLEAPTESICHLMRCVVVEPGLALSRSDPYRRTPPGIDASGLGVPVPELRVSLSHDAGLAAAVVVAVDPRGSATRQ